MSKCKLVKVPKKVSKILGYKLIYTLDKEFALGDNDYATKEDITAAINWLTKELEKTGGQNV